MVTLTKTKDSTWYLVDFHIHSKCNKSCGTVKHTEGSNANWAYAYLRDFGEQRREETWREAGSCGLLACIMVPSWVQ